MDNYQKILRALLSPAERQILQKLSTPNKVQDFLDSFPVLHLGRGEQSMKSPRQVLKIKKAHCMEGALLAATSLAYHGREPLLLDFQTIDEDEDHVLAIFKEKQPTKGGRNKYAWGAISKTNHPVLRWRDPVYTSVRELAMSYFHEYYMWGKKLRGKKTLRAYSRPFNLKQYDPAKWVTAPGNLDWLAEDLDASPHFPIASASVIKKLRNATEIEMKAMKLEEWPKRKK